jgi:hypothetical protein
MDPGRATMGPRIQPSGIACGRNAVHDFFWPIIDSRLKNATPVSEGSRTDDVALRTLDIISSSSGRFLFAQRQCVGALAAQPASQQRVFKGAETVLAHERPLRPDFSRGTRGALSR